MKKEKNLVNNIKIMRVPEGKTEKYMIEIQLKNNRTLLKFEKENQLADSRSPEELN